jgi:AcrR family transcriptional regulator
MEKPVPLRQRKKDATRRALLAAAHRHFKEKGFEATTIDALCEEAGVSRRTFFRYFDDKEGLVFPNRHERLERFLAFLEAAPREESAFVILRQATRTFAKEYGQNREQLVARQKLIDGSPSLKVREIEIDRDWAGAIAEAIVQRTGRSREQQLRALVFAGAVMGVVRATMRHWFAQEGRPDLARLGDDALDCLEKGFARDPRPPANGPAARNGALSV